MMISLSDGGRIGLRLAHFKKKVRELPEIRIPEAVRLAAEEQGFIFN